MSLVWDRVRRASVWALLWFPLIDFTLRHLLPYPVLASIWSVVLFVLLGIQAVSAYRVRSVRTAPRFRWIWFAGLYIAYTLILTLAGLHHPVLALEGFRADVYYLVFGLLVAFAVNRDEVPGFFHVIVTLAVLLGVHGIFQYIIGVPIPKNWVDVNEHLRTRVFSIITSPNELGAYMALTEPLLAGLFFFETNRLRKWMYGLGFLACFLTQLFTFDRGSLLALVAAVVVTAFFVNRKLLLVVLGLGVVVLCIPAMYHRLMDLFSPLYVFKSLQGGRLERWHSALVILQHHPLFGAGIGRYGGSVAYQFKLGAYSDNYYVKVLGESGIVGLVLFVSMHVALLWEVYQKAVKKIVGREHYVAVGGFIGLLAIVFHNLVENVFEFGPNTILYFSVAMLLLVWARQRDDNPLNMVS